ncbi:MAG TPA: acetyltransferase [Gammaproteobacteria bacterium]|jgi:hypothetical protein
MFLKVKANADLIEVLSMRDLFDPFMVDLVGRYQRGEEVQDPEKFAKSDLVFPSGEALPQCWVDPHYRQ